MRRVLWLLVALPLGFLLVMLSVANRHDVRLILDPVASGEPALAIEAPLFVYLFAALILGIVVGGAATRLGRGRRPR